MKKMWINSAWVDSASGQTIEVNDPATEEVLDAVPAGTPEDVERAVAASKRAFPAWWQTTAVERAQMLHEAAAKMREHFDELARLLTLEEGKPVPENEEEIDWSLNTLDYYAELGRHIRGRVIPSPDDNQRPGSSAHGPGGHTRVRNAGRADVLARAAVARVGTEVHAIAVTVVVVYFAFADAPLALSSLAALVAARAAVGRVVVEVHAGLTAGSLVGGANGDAQGVRAELPGGASHATRPAVGGGRAQIHAPAGTVDLTVRTL